MTPRRTLSPVPDRFDPALLRTALAAVPVGVWSLPSRFADTRVHHGYRRVELVSACHRTRHASPFGFVLDGLAPVWAAWLSWIDPGGFIVPHTDGGPWRERWQVPVEPAGEFHADDTFTPIEGLPFRVQHWLPHAVVNRTDRPRIHVVVDRDVVVDPRKTPFAVRPLPESLTDLVERSLHGSHDA